MTRVLKLQYSNEDETTETPDLDNSSNINLNTNNEESTLNLIMKNLYNESNIIQVKIHLKTI